MERGVFSSAPYLKAQKVEKSGCQLCRRAESLLRTFRFSHHLFDVHDEHRMRHAHMNSADLQPCTPSVPLRDSLGLQEGTDGVLVVEVPECKQADPTMMYMHYPERSSGHGL